MAFRDVDDKAAARVGGDFLTVPEDAKKKSYTRKKDGAEVSTHTWNEYCVIDDVVMEEGTDKDTGMETENCRIQLRVSDAKPSGNTGKVRSLFGYWAWDLADYTDEDIKERADAAVKGEPESFWPGKLMRMQMSSKSMSSLLKALGHQDRLVNRQIFRGLRKIEDIAPTFIGRNINVTFQNSETSEDGAKENILGFGKP